MGTKFVRALIIVGLCLASLFAEWGAHGLLQSGYMPIEAYIQAAASTSLMGVVAAYLYSTAKGPVACGLALFLTPCILGPVYWLVPLLLNHVPRDLVWGGLLLVVKNWAMIGFAVWLAFRLPIFVRWRDPEKSTV